MYHEIYIVTRQKFFESRGCRYTCTDNNPVVAAFESLSGALDWAERFKASNESSGYKVAVINHHSSVGLMFSYEYRDENNLIERCYNIIHETVLS